MDTERIDTPRKARQRLGELEVLRERLAQERAAFIGRANQVFAQPPMTLQFAPRRELVWRKRVRVTGGPQSTVEFYTPAGRAFLETLPPHMLARYLELEEERIRLNLRSQIVQSEIRHIRQYLAKYDNVRLLRQQTIAANE
jgi:hypothetical protein